MPDDEYFEITGATDSFVEMVGDNNKCSIHVHAEPTEAAAICGAMIASAIETYFKVADKAEIPRVVALKPLIISIEQAFSDAGSPIKIEQEDED